MKTQQKPFMVEIRRGTSRSAFISPSQEPDVFRKAEALLFRSTKAQTDVPSFTGPPSSPTRRILQAIEEPQVPLMPVSYTPPSARGRRPGSKNKPKARPTSGSEVIATLMQPSGAASKRRGRPLGSKNRPKGTIPPEKALTASAAVIAAHSRDPDNLNTHAAISGPAKRGRPLGSKNKPQAQRAFQVVPTKILKALKSAGVNVEADEVETAQTTNTTVMAIQNTSSPAGSPPVDIKPLAHYGVRFRDRSKILKRYVLKTEPKFGERKHRRASFLDAATAILQAMKAGNDPGHEQ